jgi:sugar lactone lactonase YvrE
MMPAKAVCVADVQNTVGECPVWRAAESALYWTDIVGRALYRLTWPQGQLTRWNSEEMIGCFAFQRTGGVIAALESGVAALTLLPEGRVAAAPRAAITHLSKPMRTNDGRCDRQGRLWFSSMFMDIPAARAVGQFYRYDGETASDPGHPLEMPMNSASWSQCPEIAQLEGILKGLIIANGCAFSPDGATMYVADAHASVRQVWAFDYDTATGTPHHRRRFIDMNRYPGRPDGAAVDADGCYWIAAPDAGCVHRFTPHGVLDRSIALPIKKPTMCAFGGADLRTLFVTSIRPLDIDLTDQPLAGGVFAIETDVQGLPEPEFAQ